jgi:hypothetical protein
LDIGPVFISLGLELRRIHLLRGWVNTGGAVLAAGTLLSRGVGYRSVYLALR